MLQGRDPASYSCPSTSKVTGGTDTKNTGEYNTTFPASSQQLVDNRVETHNPCGFRLPALLKKPDRKRYPSLFEKGLEKFKTLAKFYAYKGKLKSLFGQDDLDTPQRQFIAKVLESEALYKLLHHDKKNDKIRCRRSERVESALFLCLQVILYSTNLVNMRCGFFDGSLRFLNYDYGYLVAQTGLSPICVKRSMKLLQEVGLCTTHNIRKTLPNGEIITTDVYIETSQTLFEMLDLEDEFLDATQWAHAKHQEKKDRLAKKTHALNLVKLNKVFNVAKRSTKKALSVIKKLKFRKQDPATSNKQILNLAHTYLSEHVGSTAAHAMKWAQNQVIRGPT